MRNLTQVEGMSLDVLKQGIDWNFETFPEYMAMLKQKGSAINIAAYVGHSSVRTWVMGEQANKREATPEEACVAIESKIFQSRMSDSLRQKAKDFFVANGSGAAARRELLHLVMSTPEYQLT